VVVALVVGDDARDGVRVIVPHAAGGDAAEHVAFSVRACCQCVPSWPVLCVSESGLQHGSGLRARARASMAG
jgi:hypothetical protein